MGNFLLLTTLFSFLRYFFNSIPFNLYHIINEMNAYSLFFIFLLAAFFAFLFFMYVKLKINKEKKVLLNENEKLNTILQNEEILLWSYNIEYDSFYSLNKKHTLFRKGESLLSIKDIIHPAYYSAFYYAFVSLLNKKKLSSSIKTCFLSKDKNGNVTEDFYTINMYGSTNKKNELYKIMGVAIKLQDSTILTKLKEDTTKAQQARKKAEEENKQTDKYLKSISFEFRTPLNIISGFAQVADSINKDERQKVKNLVEEQTARLVKLIENIIYIYGFKDGEYYLTNKPFNLSQTIDKIAINMQKKLKPNIAIQTKCPSTNSVFNLDEKYISVIIENLVDNANKFTEQGFIIISYLVKEDKDKHTLTLCVSDTGMGIDKKYTELIFRPFGKIDKFSEGRGLGLNVCTSILEKYKGSITFESTVNKGTEFWVSIPLD